MSKRVIKYFKAPTFTEAEWSARNPFLKKGEVGYVADDITGKVIGAKVGPGEWNDLELQGENLYPYDDVPTNPIGDANENLEGTALADIIFKMLNPYQPPVISSFVHNAGGSFANNLIREIGNQISGSIQIQYAITNTENLSGAEPINIDAGDIFSNEGDFADGSPLTLNLAAPLNPSIVTRYTIYGRATHDEGVTSPVSASIDFFPKIMWGVSALTSLTGAQFMAISNKGNVITDEYKRDYSFNGNGYSWIALPAMLSPSSLVFTDVTNPNLPANYSMEPMGTISINNGVTTYNYVMYRSTFFLINPTILRIS
jgi:hypothetical protein